MPTLDNILHILGLLIGGGLLWRLWDLAEWKGSVTNRLDANDRDHARYEEHLR